MPCSNLRIVVIVGIISVLNCQCYWHVSLHLCHYYMRIVVIYMYHFIYVNTVVPVVQCPWGLTECMRAAWIAYWQGFGPQVVLVSSGDHPIL